MLRFSCLAWHCLTSQELYFKSHFVSWFWFPRKQPPSKAAVSSLAGPVRGCVGLCGVMQGSAKQCKAVQKNSSVKYFFFHSKYFMSSAFHPKLVGHKVIKQLTSLQHRSSDFHLSQFPVYAQRRCASFFGTTLIALHLQGKEGYRLWRLGFCFVHLFLRCLVLFSFDKRCSVFTFMKAEEAKSHFQK